MMVLRFVWIKSCISPSKKTVYPPLENLFAVCLRGIGFHIRISSEQEKLKEIRKIKVPINFEIILTGRFSIKLAQKSMV